MKFSERKEILEEIEIQKELRHGYLIKYLRKFALLAFALIIGMTSHGKKLKSSTPSENDIAIAKTFTTIENRETAIDEKYDGAKITKERTYGKDIISVFEVGYMHSFCVFEALEDGYWMEYCGSLFPKTELVKGTILLGDNTHEYDVYLQNENIYSYLLIDRVNMTQPHNVQQQQIRFDENGIALMKLDPEIHDPAPRIVGYDAEGNLYILADGTL